MEAGFSELKKHLSNDTLLFQQETLEYYSHDETEDLRFLPQAVAKPATVEEVSTILRICNEHRIPVTPMGARTGLSGGALPVCGGVALSMERFDKILNIDTFNQQVLVEPGVITQVLQEEVQKQGLYYAPDPASRGSCFIGGNIAENSGGPRAVKYGVTKDWVLNLEVVLPNGEVIWTGANTLKNSTGYNMTQLIVGSEGTLGVVTKAVLKLIPYPKYNLLMLAPFTSAGKACEAVSAIFRAGVTPSALEFMEQDAISITSAFIGERPFDFGDTYAAHLLIEVDGQDMDGLMKECEVITEVLEGYECGEILFAESQSQKDKLWMLRRKVGEAVKTTSVYKEEDTVVPRYHLPELLAGVKEIGKEFGFRSVCYGHAGDGNLHINILRDGLSDEFWNDKLKEAITRIFLLTKKLGGTISGEHGIGWVQKEYMSLIFKDSELDLMRGIKSLFDPNDILNPSKMFPKMGKL
ncbi:MAG: FAD-binding protein [Flavobacteriales bacterium]|nr:FAD-binding protein [Flavobacteriales bacterium]